MNRYHDIVEYVKGVLCISAGWMIEEGVVSLVNLMNLIKRGKMRRLRRGGNGRSAMIEFSTMPLKYQNIIRDKIGNPYDYRRYEWAKKYFVADEDAVLFYSKYFLPDGRLLPQDKQIEYSTNAMMLNASEQIYNELDGRRGSLSGSRRGLWDIVVQIITYFKGEYRHTLPSNTRRFKDKLKRYKQDGYTSLIHRNYGNQNSRKVNLSLERLILSIYVMKHKPYITEVLDTYLEFLSGKLDIVDVSTGEIFNRADFFKEDGSPITISETTAWNYLNDPKNRAIVDAKRNDRLYYSSTHRPHHFRKRPQYALSKISMDDRDLPFVVKEGGKSYRVKGYYIYDVMSGAIIGKAFSRKKDTRLFIEALRDMFRFLHKNDLGVPYEIEIEHHIAEGLKTELEMLFPFVHFAAAGNAQEKRAEHYNRQLRYGYEKKYDVSAGRHYARLEANRPPQDKKFFSDGTIEDNRKYYTYDLAVSMALSAIDDYNNDGRIEKFFSNMHPKLVRVSEAMIMRYIGERRTTSIRRNQYVRVQYEYYSLPSADVISRLEPGNYKVTAYYLPNEQGSIDKVYLWQGDTYIGECPKIISYNESIAEATEEDKAAFVEQRKYISQFDKMIKESVKNKIAKVEVISNEEIVVSDEDDLVFEEPQIDENDMDNNVIVDEIDWAKKALDDL